MAVEQNPGATDPAAVTDGDVARLAPPNEADRVPGLAAPPDPAHADEDAAGPRRTVPVIAVILALVAALGTGTWLASGFSTDPGRLARLPVGTEVDMGPMSFAVDRAVADQSGKRWSVYLMGRCHNNGDEAITAGGQGLTRNGFSVRHPLTKEVVGDAGLSFGAGETLGKSNSLNPGMPWVPCTLSFMFDNFPESDTITLGVSKMEWRDISPTGLQNMAWSATRYGWRFEVPLVMRPETGP